MYIISLTCHNLHTILYLRHIPQALVGNGVAQWWSVGLRSERSGIQNLPPPCCVLEQDTLLPESTGHTQEAVALSRHD